MLFYISAKLLLEREHDWNPSVSPNRQIKYKTVFNKYEGRTVTLDLVENMKDSKLVKVSSFEDQQTRERAIVGLRNGSKQVLISTNVCSRGLDLPNIDMVINYCMPEWHDGRAFEGLGRANNDFIYRYFKSFIESFSLINHNLRIGRMCRVGQQVHGKKTLSAVSFFSPSPENQNWSKGQNPIIAAKQIHGHGPSASERMVPFIFNEIFQFNNIGDLGDAAPFIEAYYNKGKKFSRFVSLIPGPLTAKIKPVQTVYLNFFKYDFSDGESPTTLKHCLYIPCYLAHASVINTIYLKC